MTRIEPNESLFLDLIRASSAQLVLWGHLLSFLDPAALIGSRIQVQNLGVVIFFILSGYLICTSMRKYDDFSAFFVDRFARIYVTFVPCLMIIALLDYVSIRSGVYEYLGAFNLVTFFGNLLMLQDHPVFYAFNRAGVQIGITSFGSGRPLWTLAVEWWLYMFFGWLYLARRRSLILLMLLAIVPVAHATYARGEGLTLFWLLGAVIAWVRLPELTSRAALGISGAFIVLAALRSARGFYDMQVGIFLAAALSAGIVWARNSNLLLRLPSPMVSFLRLMAGASYALYAVHYSVIEFVRSWTLSASQTLVLAALLSHVIAFSIYLVFDRNHKRVAAFLKRRVASTPAARPPSC